MVLDCAGRKASAAYGTGRARAAGDVSFLSRREAASRRESEPRGEGRKRLNLDNPRSLGTDAFTA